MQSNFPSFQFTVRVAKAFNTIIKFPIVITTAPPSPTDPVQSPQEIYKVLAQLYRAAHFAVEFVNRKKSNAGGQTMNDESGEATNGKC